MTRRAPARQRLEVVEINKELEEKKIWDTARHVLLSHGEFRTLLLLLPSFPFPLMCGTNFPRMFGPVL